MKLHFCFSTHLPAGFRVPRHAHDVLELVYYLSGTGRTRMGGESYPIAHNHFAIIPGGMLHDEATGGPVSTVCLGLGESGLETHRGYFSDAGGSLRRLLELMLVENRQRKPGYGAILEGLATQATGMVVRIRATEPRAPQKIHLVESALAIIKETRGQVKVRQLADDLFVSEDYLSHLIRDHTRHSPIRHIIAERLAHAETALSGSKTPVSEIARLCGFESPNHFSRLFKKNRGLTPAAYRRAQSKKA
ncbi:MAG: helix-turn-helix domain-containing protein [Spirochaetes bacterium]|nr:helix-turn-helix domain-containing protein [Spirochaetota bacterium]